MSTPDTAQTTVNFFNGLAEELAGENVACGTCTAIPTDQNDVELSFPVTHTIKIPTEHLMFRRIDDIPFIPRGEEEFLEITGQKPLSTFWNWWTGSKISQFTEFHKLYDVVQNARNYRAITYLNEQWTSGELAHGKLTTDENVWLNNDYVSHITLKVNGTIHAHGDSDKPNSADKNCSTVSFQN